MTSTTRPAGDGWQVLERLHAATNNHDLEAIVACFAPDYRNETPAHPERSFTGREQVRRNWTQILAAVPDVTTVTVRHAVDGDTVWSEQEHRGTRSDGSPHVMRGVVIFTVADGLINRASFYLEPVQQGGSSVDEVIARQVGPRPKP
jgi:ketosteroid isomerase-like protein